MKQSHFQIYRITLCYAIRTPTETRTKLFPSIFCDFLRTATGSQLTRGIMYGSMVLCGQPALDHDWTGVRAIAASNGQLRIVSLPGSQRFTFLRTGVRYRWRGSAAWRGDQRVIKSVGLVKLQIKYSLSYVQLWQFLGYRQDYAVDKNQIRSKRLGFETTPHLMAEDRRIGYQCFLGNLHSTSAVLPLLMIHHTPT